MFALTKTIPSKTRETGFSLVELMIGLTVGLLIIAGVTTLFVTNNKTRVELEKTSQQIENGRYASQLLLEDLRLAGYYGELNPTTSVVATPATLPDACATDTTSLTAAIALPIQGYDNGASIPTSCSSYLTDLKSGSDVLVVRRVSSCAENPTTGVPVTPGTSCGNVNTTLYTYFQTSLCGETPLYGININTLHGYHNSGCSSTAAVWRQLYTRIYFVTNNNKSGDGIPTLRVAELGNGSFTVSALASGIEQLQLEYGIDTNGDGVPDLYTANPSIYNSCSGTACQTNWRTVTAVKIHILARNNQTSAGFTDTRKYILGKLADMTTDNTYGQFNDGYKRHVYTTVVRLTNVAGRYE